MIDSFLSFFKVFSRSWVDWPCNPDVVTLFPEAAQDATGLKFMFKFVVSNDLSSYFLWIIVHFYGEWVVEAVWVKTRDLSHCNMVPYYGTEKFYSTSHQRQRVTCHEVAMVQYFSATKRQAQQSHKSKNSDITNGQQTKHSIGTTWTSSQSWATTPTVFFFFQRERYTCLSLFFFLAGLSLCWYIQAFLWIGAACSWKTKHPLLLWMLCQKGFGFWRSSIYHC